MHRISKFWLYISQSKYDLQVENLVRFQWSYKQKRSHSAECTKVIILFHTICANNRKRGSKFKNANLTEISSKFLTTPNLTEYFSNKLG
jgi:hypothetical protein